MKDVGVSARRDVEDVVVRLFVATDRRDWFSVEACLADRVLLDMTSMTGGEPQDLTAGDVVAGWKNGLAPIDHVHHQVGNFQTEVDGDRATVSCYGIAFHHRDGIASPAQTRTFVGSYDIRLARTGGMWRIDRFRFQLAFIDGNPDLEKAT